MMPEVLTQVGEAGEGGPDSCARCSTHPRIPVPGSGRKREWGLHAEAEEGGLLGRREPKGGLAIRPPRNPQRPPQSGPSRNSGLEKEPPGN